jgi:hypothetical protein
MTATFRPLGGLSPHVVAKLAIFVEWLFAAMVVLLPFVPAIGAYYEFYLVVAAAAVPFALRWLNRCPGCRKRTTTEVAALSKYEWAGRCRPLLWPETECSQCGVDLTKAVE